MVKCFRSFSSHIAFVLCTFVNISILYASPVSLPQQTLTVSATSNSGASFTYSGNLTNSDTLGLTASGIPCLTSGGTFCINAAGVDVVPGDRQFSEITVGKSLQNTSNNTTYGSLLFTISGVGTKQVFATNNENGSNSPNPPRSLQLLATPLSSLGFSDFSAINPVITFQLSDTDYTNNSGNFLLTQSTVINPVPEPSSISLAIVGIFGLFVGSLCRTSARALFAR